MKTTAISEKFLNSISLIKKSSLTEQKKATDIISKIYPGDNRLNECLQAIQEFKDGKISREQLNEKRREAAYAAYTYSADGNTCFARDAYAAANIALRLITPLYKFIK